MASGPIGLIGRNFGQLRGAMAAGMPRILAGFAAVAAGAITLSAGLATFRTAWDFAQAAGQFDREMAAVQTISQATAEEFDSLGQAAVEAGIRTQFAPEQAAAGLRVLSQQGLIAADSVNALVPVLDFAAAGNIDVAEAAEVAMGVMNAYGMTVDDITSVTDRLMRGTQLSALSANEFSLIMGRAASSGRIFGTGLDDVIIALGSLRSAGIPATVATTALDNAMRRLTTDQRALTTLQNEFNISVEDSEGNLRSVIDITRDFADATRDRSEAERAQLVAQIFGVRGLRAFNAIANIQARVMRDGEVVTIRGAEAMRHYRSSLADSAGTTEEFRRRTLATFQGQMVLLQGTIETFRTVFGRTFGVLFRPVMIAVTESINLVARTWRGLSDRTQRVIAVFALSSASFAIVTGFLMTMGGIIVLVVTLLGSLLGTLAAVMGGIVLAMLPVIAIFAAASAVAYTLYRAYQDNLGGLADFVDAQISRIRLAWQGLVEIFTQGHFSEAVSEQLGLAENEGIRPFIMTIRDLWARVRSIAIGFREAWSGVWASLGPVIEELRGAFTNLMSEVSSAFGGITDGANTIPFSQFESFGAMLAETVGGALRSLIQGLTTVIRVVLGVWRVFRSVRDFLMPFFELWVANMRPVIALLRLLWDIISAIHRITQIFNPVAWIRRGLEAVGRRGEPGTEEARRARPRDDPFDVFQTDQRRREADDRTEASTRRPAAAEGEARGGDIDALLASLEGLEAPGAGGARRLENRVTLEVDRRTLGEVIQSLDLDDETGAGGVVTDEFGNRSSVME
jgi:TP901 family phage tail tape measure protein